MSVPLSDPLHYMAMLYNDMTWLASIAALPGSNSSGRPVQPIPPLLPELRVPAAQLQIRRTRMANSSLITKQDVHYLKIIIERLFPMLENAVETDQRYETARSNDQLRSLLIIICKLEPFASYWQQRLPPRIPERAQRPLRIRQNFQEATSGSHSINPQPPTLPVNEHLSGLSFRHILPDPPRTIEQIEAERRGRQVQRNILTQLLWRPRTRGTPRSRHRAWFR